MALMDLNFAPFTALANPPPPRRKSGPTLKPHGSIFCGPAKVQAKVQPQTYDVHIPVEFVNNWPTQSGSCNRIDVGGNPEIHVQVFDACCDPIAQTVFHAATDHPSPWIGLVVTRIGNDGTTRLHNVGVAR